MRLEQPEIIKVIRVIRNVFKKLKFIIDKNILLWS